VVCRRHIYLQVLGISGREGGVIKYHEVMLNVELVFDERLHPADGRATP
jgi:hypothetical protein